MSICKCEQGEGIQVGLRVGCEGAGEDEARSGAKERGAQETWQFFGKRDRGLVVSRKEMQKEKDRTGWSNPTGPFSFVV